MRNQNRPINLSAWVEKGKVDPVRYRQRQVTEILLSAVAIVPSLQESLYLKGGILMNLVYESPRSTSDVDFSTPADPHLYPLQFRNDLNTGLQRAASALGYIDLICRVQSIKEQPRSFPNAIAPALRVKIGSALRGTNEEKKLQEGQASQTLQVDINFYEPVENIEPIVLDVVGELNGYSLVEVIAEKLRALLQQKTRNRNRRQDVYDIAYLLRCFPLDAEEKNEVFRMLRIKSEARNLTLGIDAISDPEIAHRAKADWEAIRDELEEELPEFDGCFAEVEAFYRSLPWPL